MLGRKPVNVRRIDGSIELLDSQQVIIADWLHVVEVGVTEQNPEQIEIHRVIGDLVMKETETHSEVAARLMKNSRVQMANPTYPHGTEGHFF